MSRAFVKEEDADAPVVLAPKPVSSAKNYMTKVGFAAMEQDLAAFSAELDAAAKLNDISQQHRQAELRREIHYLQTRLHTAEVIEQFQCTHIRFAHHVVFVDESGKEYQFQIVGEDEADITKAKLSWTAPLAKALIGHEVGDSLIWQKGDEKLAVEVLEISL